MEKNLTLSGYVLWKGNRIARVQKKGSDFPWMYFDVMELIGPSVHHESLARSTEESGNPVKTDVSFGEHDACVIYDWTNFVFEADGELKHHRSPIRMVSFWPNKARLGFRYAHERAGEKEV